MDRRVFQDRPGPQAGPDLRDRQELRVKLGPQDRQVKLESREPVEGLALWDNLVPTE